MPSQEYPQQPDSPVDEHAKCGRRLQVAFDLHRFGITAMRMNLMRQDPDADDQTIRLRLAHWLGHDGFEPVRFGALTVRTANTRRHR